MSRTQSTPSPPPSPLVFVNLIKFELVDISIRNPHNDNILGYKFDDHIQYAYFNESEHNYKFLGQYTGYTPESYGFGSGTGYGTAATFKFTKDIVYEKNIEKIQNWVKVHKLENYDVRSFKPTDNKLIFVFWGNKFCKLAKVGTTSNKITLELSLQCNDVIYHVDINGQDLDTQLTAGKKNKKRTTKRLSKNKRNKTRKHKKSRR